MRIAKLLVIVLFTSCLPDRNDDSLKELPAPKQIVLIFKGFPKDYIIQLNDTKGKAYSPVRPEVSYYDDHLIKRIIKPNADTTDTIVIACQGPIEFQHNVKGFDTFEYRFKNGDTVVFNYREKIPIATVTNRVTSDYEVNYDLKQREIICKNDYPALTKVMMPFAFVTYNSNFIGGEGERPGILGQIDKVKSAAQLRFSKEMELERIWLDSLRRETLISRESYERLTQKLKIKEATVKIYNDELGRTEIRSILTKDLDSILSHHAYRDLLTTIRSTFYERKGKRIITSNSNLPDYTVVYDSVLHSNLFTPKAKEILLFETSNLVMENNSATKIDLHLREIKADIKDSLLVSYLVDKYNLKEAISNELQIIDVNKNKTTLENLIKENPNKIVYVDFWASWCAPCIEEFAQSKIMRERLKGRNVEFIFLSIDDDQDRWMSSSRKNGLPEKYSFLVKNKKTSKFLESLNFNLIPRYLLFNKKGKLEFENAPRPSDHAATQLIEELLRRD